MAAAMIFTGFTPDFHLSVNQYFAQDMQDIYNTSAAAGAGMHISLSPNRAFRTGIDFSFDRGEVWDYWRTGQFRGYSYLTALCLETGWEFSAPFFQGKNFYWGVGPVLGVGGERIPASDTSGNIISRTDWGTGLGGKLFLGARVVPLGRWSLGVESGIRLLAIPIRNEWGRYSIDLSGLSLTITFGR